MSQKDQLSRDDILGLVFISSMMVTVVLFSNLWTEDRQPVSFAVFCSLSLVCLLLSRQKIILLGAFGLFAFFRLLWVLFLLRNG